MHLNKNSDIKKDIMLKNLKDENEKLKLSNKELNNNIKLYWKTENERDNELNKLINENRELKSSMG